MSGHGHVYVLPVPDAEKWDRVAEACENAAEICADVASGVLRADDAGESFLDLIRSIASVMGADIEWAMPAIEAMVTG